MKLIRCIFTSLFLALGCLQLYAQEQKKGEIHFNYESLSNNELEESLIPIWQGEAFNMPFWNKYAKRFIYAPAFDFNEIEGAVNYQFVATASNFDFDVTMFTTKNPWDNLAPIWLKLPQGYIDLEVVGLDSNGQNLGQAGTRKFYKAAPFNGPYNQKVVEYDESYKRALEYIFQKNYIQHWKIDGTPDTLTYQLYCYPAKIMGAVVESMILYSQLSSTNKSSALTIAKNAADYLIKISEPANAPLAFFPPTYMGNRLSAKHYKGQSMIIYPARLAHIYLDLFKLTQNTKYYDAAVNIANTYAKLQLPNGTWYLKVWEDGTPVKETLCIPIDIIEFLERLRVEFKITDYEEVEKNALSWIFENPVKTFDWSGQFEDINPSIRYKNLTKHDAASFAIYLFKHADKMPDNLKLAEELLRFSEDQFVVWEKPMPHQYPRAQQWILPTALEQYEYYVPIDASVAKMMNTYLFAHKATGKEIYLAKAVELANAMTQAQLKETGRYPTYWERNDERLQKEGWINCAVSDVKAMMNIQSYILENDGN